MTDRPILFSAPMVRALLDGTKAQTRRVLKPLTKPSLFDGTWSDDYVLHAGNAEWRARDIRFAIGDRLWVRETWACHCATNDQKPSEIDRDMWSVRYFADDHVRPAARDGSLALLDQCKKKRVAIFMPRWASRLTLTVTDVRVQRLQDISEEDAIAEGILVGPPLSSMPESHGDIYHDGATDPIDGWTRNPVEAYQNLWTHINGPDAWDANPWVVAVSFTVHQCNIDDMKGAA